MPDIPTSSNITIFFIVISYLNTIQNTLRCSNLIRSHYHKHIFRSENTILRDYIKNSMFCKKCSCEVNQIRNNTIVCIRPKASKFKTVACFAFLCSRYSIYILYSIETGTVRIVLRVSSI